MPKRPRNTNGAARSDRNAQFRDTATDFSLAEQLPQIWNDERVDICERKRIVRLLIEDVTLIKAESITAHVGCLAVPRARCRWSDLPNC